MEFIRPDTKIDFVGNRYKAFAVSIIVLLAGLAALAHRGGLVMGVDFAGGTLIQVRFKQPTTPDRIRGALDDLTSHAMVQQIGSAGDNEYLVRADTISGELQSLSEVVEKKLADSYGQGVASVQRVEMVGPKVGEDLREKALLAIYYALLILSIYISGRFEFKWAKSGIMAAGLVVGVYLLEAFGMNAHYVSYGALFITLALCWFLQLPYALGTLLSLAHDVLVIVGVFALTGKEFTLEVLAAVLTLVGFSLNDTIIVYDRIRENVRKNPKGDFHEIVNASINQTLSRTILTSGTVFLVAACLFFLGGSVIHDFAFALLIGIITGTFSSIFVAAPLLIAYDDLRRSQAARKRT